MVVQSSEVRRQRKAPADRRSEIIEIATTLVSERGYWGVSVHDIAAGCGITDAGVLHHFGTKGNLLLAVMAHRDEVDRVALAEILGVAREELYASIGSIELGQLCEAFVSRNAQQPEIVRLYAVLSAEALDPHHPAHEYFAERERVAIRTFGQAHSTDAGDPTQRGRLVLAAMDGIQLRWLRDPGALDLVAEWRAVYRRLFAASSA